LLKFPNRITLEEAVLIEPLSVSVHAARLANLRHGNTVLIFGSGTIGLLCAAVAKTFGAKKIVAVDILDTKLSFAREWNLSDIFKPNTGCSPEQNADRLLKEIELGLSADIILEASRAPSSINTGILTRKLGGSFVQVGGVGGNVDFPIQQVADRKLHIRGRYRYRYPAGDFETAMDMLWAKQIGVKNWISAILPFEKAKTAWEMTKRGQGIKNSIRGPG
jgi:D-xylulose reductase